MFSRTARLPLALALLLAATAALATPGHTRDSICLWHADERGLFTGDLVLGTGTAVLDDAPGALADYLGSLERLAGLQPRSIRARERTLCHVNLEA